MNFEGLEMKYISTDRAEKADAKMGSFIQLECLLPEYGHFKDSKNDSFFALPADDNKKLVSLGKPFI